MTTGFCSSAGFCNSEGIKTNDLPFHVEIPPAKMPFYKRSMLFQLNDRVKNSVKTPHEILNQWNLAIDPDDGFGYVNHYFQRDNTSNQLHLT